VESIMEAVQLFEEKEWLIRYRDCRDNAARFSAERFRDEFKSYVDQVFATKLTLEGVFQ
jgi:hypothetical protein